MRTLYKKLGILFSGVLISLMPTSCNFLTVEDYLYDLTPLDSVFSRQSYLEDYIWGTAAHLPNQGALFNSSYGPYETAVDEVIISKQNDDYAGTYFYAGKVTEHSTYFSNYWSKYYQGIRKCNTIFSRIGECKELDAMRKRDLLGITYFMRASFYFYLLELYGPVPLLPDKPLEVDADIEDLSFERNTYDECVDYICNDLQKASELLETQRPTTDFNIPTKYAAISLISRVRLYQASKWYNGNNYYASWTNSQGNHFINQTYDYSKWAKSAVASKRVIESGLYSLHTVASDDNTSVDESVSKLPFPEGVGGIDPYHSYADMFNGETFPENNTEFIYVTDIGNNQIQLSFPTLMGGWSLLGVTQKLVDAYRMKNGDDYEKTEDCYQSISNPPIVATGYELRPSVAKMYVNREARFYASIGFCECLWPGTSVTGSEAAMRTNIVAEYYSNGNCASSAADPDASILTGYTLKKYIHPEDNFWTSSGAGGKIKRKKFPIIRYAEILLNYVEAINELKGESPYSEEYDGVKFEISYSPDEIMKYFNMIRYRAGLPGITYEDAENQERMRELIIRERMVEFACEGRRYHDLRRWGIAHIEENKPVQGMDITKKKSERQLFYTVTNVIHKNSIRNFENKMYFYPIPRNVLNKNPKLVQNPGWSGYSEW